MPLADGLTTLRTLGSVCASFQVGGSAVCMRWRWIAKEAAWGAILFTGILMIFFPVVICALNPFIFNANWSANALIIPPLLIGPPLGTILRGTIALMKERARCRAAGSSLTPPSTMER